MTHRGIERNEVAEKLAKEAAQDVDQQNIIYDGIPTTAVACHRNKDERAHNVANTMGQY